MKEKTIEKQIISYLLSQGAICEGIQSGSIMVKKPGYNHRMTLQSAGCPDIICLIKGMFIGIEVKRNEDEVNKWIKLRDRFYGIGKTLDGLTSYEREKDQIKYAKRIEDNGGEFLITCDINEVISLIEFYAKQSKV